MFRDFIWNPMEPLGSRHNSLLNKCHQQTIKSISHNTYCPLPLHWISGCVPFLPRPPFMYVCVCLTNVSVFSMLICYAISAFLYKQLNLASYVPESTALCSFKDLVAKENRCRWVGLGVYILCYPILLYGRLIE